MRPVARSAAVLAALEAWDAAFASGDADGYAAMFCDDAQVLLLYGAPLVGREAIRADAARTFTEWDTSAWRTERLIVEVHPDRAYAVSSYSETLVHRERAKPSRSIEGRIVHFLRRELQGWCIALALNAHSRRVVELGPEAPTAGDRSA